VLTSLLNVINVGQVYLQISVHRLHTETFQRLTAFQLELDDVSRERHEEVIDVSRMSESEREVRAAMFFDLNQVIQHGIAAAPYENTCKEW
jgi:hypothetical protein